MIYELLFCFLNLYIYIYILFPKPTINAENSNPTSGPGADEHQPELALEGVCFPTAPTCQNTLTHGSEREEGSREPPDPTDRLIALTSRTAFSMQRTRHANASNTHTHVRVVFYLQADGSAALVVVLCLYSH